MSGDKVDANNPTAQYGSRRGTLILDIEPSKGNDKVDMSKLNSKACQGALNLYAQDESALLLAKIGSAFGMPSLMDSTLPLIADAALVGKHCGATPNEIAEYNAAKVTNSLKPQ